MGSEAWNIFLGVRERERIVEKRQQLKGGKSWMCFITINGKSNLALLPASRKME